MALQSDGKVLIVGARGTGASSDFLIARYTSSGALDTTFGAQGYAAAGNSGAAAHAIAVQGDGKVIVAGTDNNKISVLRFTASGTLDEAFGKGGRAVAAGTENSEGRAVALGRDGTITVAGYTERATADVCTMARWNTRGEADSDFGKEGVFHVSFGSPSDRAHAVTIQPDGKTLAAGRTHDVSTNDAFALLRTRP